MKLEKIEPLKQKTEKEKIGTGLSFNDAINRGKIHKIRKKHLRCSSSTKFVSLKRQGPHRSSKICPYSTSFYRTVNKF